jgi:hypothetical protein
MTDPQPDPPAAASEGPDGPAAALDASNLIVPGTGEVVSLNAPTDMLADTVLKARGAERELRELRRQIEAELQGRMHAAERSVLYGDEYEVRIPERNDAVWDEDDLEDVLRDLIEQGTLLPAEVVGVITHETRVSKSAAGRLVKRLRGAARQRVESCRHWQKSYGAVEVTRAQQLIPSEAQTGLEEAKR